MELILLENIGKLGKLGDKVTVKAGYGRNYLVPQGKAVPATEKNLAEFEARRAELEKAAAEVMAAAQARAEQLDGMEISILSRAGEEGKLFGSIGNRDVADAVTAAGVEVDKNEVRMPEGPLRHTGEFDIEVQLHAEVTAVVKVIVVAE